MKKIFFFIIFGISIYLQVIIQSKLELKLKVRSLDNNKVTLCLVLSWWLKVCCLVDLYYSVLSCLAWPCYCQNHKIFKDIKMFFLNLFFVKSAICFSIKKIFKKLKILLDFLLKIWSIYIEKWLSYGALPNVAPMSQWVSQWQT